MNTETTKLAIAIEYLDTAAILWLHEINFFSALHLAAASEEISGKACRIDKIESDFDVSRSRIRKTLDTLKIKYTDKEIIAATYSAKNSVKHMDSINDSTVNIDPREQSANYIASAYRNFEKLGLHEMLSNSVKRVIDANTIYVEVE